MPPGTADNAATHIRSLNESWLAAASRRDLAGMMAVYAPDAQELLPDMLPLVGRDSIRAFYKSLIERLPRFAHHFAPEEITVASSGDLAVVRGSYRFTPDTLKPRQVYEGKYVGVWRRRAGEWRLFINISNGNAPASTGS
ncbi:MAG: YybH family protein [Thermoanaerobaculia bacterium]